MKNFLEKNMSGSLSGEEGGGRKKRGGREEGERCTPRDAEDGGRMGGRKQVENLQLMYKYKHDRARSGTA